jgi:hypothetical protein
MYDARVHAIERGPALAQAPGAMERRRQNPVPDDFRGLSATRVQTKTVCVAPDELETVHEQVGQHAVLEDVKAYLRAVGVSDEGTCMGDMVMSGAMAPQVLPAPIVAPEPRIESVARTVHAYCEPLLPFLPVEDLAAPSESDLVDEDLYEPQPLPESAIIANKGDDPILEYLREVSADFSPSVEPTGFHVSQSLAQIAPRAMAPEPTVHEQAAVKTSFIRYQRPAKSNFSARVLAVKKRRTPLWAAALMGMLIAVLLLTSSIFTVEVLASKIGKAKAEKVETTEAPELIPWVVPR